MFWGRAEPAGRGRIGAGVGSGGTLWVRPLQPPGPGAWLPGREGAPDHAPRRALLARARDLTLQSLRGLGGVPCGDGSGSSTSLGTLPRAGWGEGPGAGAEGRGPAPAILVRPPLCHQGARGPRAAALAPGRPRPSAPAPAQPARVGPGGLRASRPRETSLGPAEVPCSCQKENQRRHSNTNLRHGPHLGSPISAAEAAPRPPFPWP